jgi:hypothetical protein
MQAGPKRFPEGREPFRRRDIQWMSELELTMERDVA